METVESSSHKKSQAIKVAVLIAVCAIGVGIAVLASIRVYRMLNPYLDREIGGPATLTSSWLEIKPEPPLRAERQVQYLYLHTPEPFVPDYQSWGIRLSDGSVVVPEVQLVDKQGIAHTLRAASFSLGDRTRTDVITGIGFRASDLPADRDYSVVRIRSSQQIKVSRIVWRNYDQSDRK